MGYLRTTRTTLLASLLMASTSTAALAQQSGVDFVFLVDESGSMSGEQAFIPTLVNNIETAFSAAGFKANRYALVGYARSNPEPHLVTPFGGPGDVATGAGTLEVSGGTEDGYDAIDFAFGNLSIRPDSGQFLLVTDEDRDVFDPAQSFNSVLGQLTGNNVGLNGIYRVSTITQIPGVTPGPAPEDGTPVAVDTINNRIYVVDSTQPNGFRRIDLLNTVNPITGGDGTTVADYVDLGKQTVGGCVGSIDEFRTNDPVIVNAFAGALVDCLTIAVVNNPGSFEATTAVVLRNFFGSSQFGQLTSSYGQLVGLNAMNPYARRRSSRGGTLGFDATPGPTPGTASGATAQYMSPDKRIGMFATYRFDWGGFDTTATTVGSNFTNYAGTIGGDYAISPEFIVGGAFGYSHYKNELRNNTDKQEVDAYTLYLYATYVAGQAYFDAVVSAGLLDQDTRRSVGGSTFKGNANGWQWGGQFRAGYDFPLSEWVVVGPSAALRYSRLGYDSYSESGGAGALRIGSQSFDALVSTLGAQATVYLNPGQPDVFALQVRGGWEHDFTGGPDAVSIAQVGGAALPAVRPDNPDRNWATTGVGINMHGDFFTLYGDVDTRVGYDDANVYFARGGVKIYF